MFYYVNKLFVEKVYLSRFSSCSVVDCYGVVYCIFHCLANVVCVWSEVSLFTLMTPPDVCITVRGKLLYSSFLKDWD